jgi:hypothetical protein
VELEVNLNEMPQSTCCDSLIHYYGRFISISSDDDRDLDYHVTAYAGLVSLYDSVISLIGKIIGQPRGDYLVLLDFGESYRNHWGSYLSHFQV